MLTVNVVTPKTLETQDEIAAHVAYEYERRMRLAPLKPGDKVRIIRRDGIPPEYLVGDVGIVLLCDPEQSPQATLLGLNKGGATIQYPAPTANLEKIG